MADKTSISTAGVCQVLLFKFEKNSTRQTLFLCEFNQSMVNQSTRHIKLQVTIATHLCVTCVSFDIVNKHSLVKWIYNNEEQTDYKQPLKLHNQYFYISQSQWIKIQCVM